MKQAIIEAGKITAEIRQQYFLGKSFGEIRNWLEANGLDRHMEIELISTEVAIQTPFGILMQVRASDNGQLGLWGGVVNDGETPTQAAVREVFEETGIKIGETDLEFVDIDTHTHQYANGDKAYFTAYRYVVHFDYVPEIQTDEESVGAFMVVHTILSHQQDFVKKLLKEK